MTSTRAAKRRHAHMIVKRCAVERAYDSQRLQVLDVRTTNTGQKCVNSGMTCSYGRGFWRVYAQGYVLNK
jgi:hypothetical protein